jgi:hypothetical protein
LSVEPPPPELYQRSPSVEPPLDLLKRLLRNSFAGMFEAGCKGYRISKRVDWKVQTKVKYLESELTVVHFLLVPVNLVKEWHQMTVIPKIRKVSTI